MNRKTLFQEKNTRKRRIFKAFSAPEISWNTEHYGGYVVVPPIVFHSVSFYTTKHTRSRSARGARHALRRKARQGPALPCLPLSRSVRLSTGRSFCLWFLYAPYRLTALCVASRASWGLSSFGLVEYITKQKTASSAFALEHFVNFRSRPTGCRSVIHTRGEILQTVQARSLDPIFV